MRVFAFAPVCRQMPFKRSRAVRRRSAQTLVEALIGCAICAMVVGILSQTLAKFMHFSGNSDQQLIARDVAQEIVDEARSLPWFDVKDSTGNVLIKGLASYAGGTYPVTINCAYGAGSAFLPRPAEVDSQNFTWQAQSLSNQFQGTATVTITTLAVNSSTNQPASVAVKAVVNIPTVAGSKQVQAFTTITQFGIHNVVS